MNSDLLSFIRNSPEIFKSKEEFESLAKESNLNVVFLDDGGGRWVYELVGENLILKVCRWSGGRLQNKNESHPAFRKYKTLFNVPIAWNKHYSVSLYTKMKPFAEKDFEQLKLVYGIRGQDLCNLCYTIQDQPEEALYTYVLENMSPNGLLVFNTLLEIHHTGPSELRIKELPADYLKPCSYGYASDGTIRIIDFGLNQDYYTLPYTL